MAGTILIASSVVMATSLKLHTSHLRVADKN